MSGQLAIGRQGKSKHGKFMNRLEAHALIALHAFPIICRLPRALPQGTPSAILHETYREEIGARLSEMMLIERVAILLVWPPAMVLWALGLTITNGTYVARHFGCGIWRQFLDQLHLAFAQGVPVNFFYTYELHDPRNRARAHEYVLRGHIKGGCRIYKRLYHDNPERHAHAKILNDKLEFHEFCRARGLPTARLFAVVSKSTFAWTNPETTALPPVDLFIKPRKENGGTGAERWAYRDGRYLRHGSAMVLAPDQLTKRLAKLSIQQTYLVYECLSNHPDICDITAGALCTLRLHTMLDETGRVEHLFTMFRMSQFRQRIVDTRDGLAAAVDPRTGTLGRSSNSSALARWMDIHPATGARITGRVVPCWPEALALALATHAELCSPFMIGWDIAVTEHGPVILEANKSPDVEVEQRLDGPWGNKRFGQLVTHFLMRPGAGAFDLVE